MRDEAAAPTLVLPRNRKLYYGGAWHDSVADQSISLINPATGEALGAVVDAVQEDVDRAVVAAQAGFEEWSRIPPRERGKILHQIAARLREVNDEMAILESTNCGNPYTEMRRDALWAADGLDYFAGIVTELKGETLPMGDGRLNYSVREPYGVVARIYPYNHPVLYAGLRSAAALAAGNSLIVKPAEQAPLSTLKFAEMIDDLVPPGTFNVITGGREAGAMLVAHHDVPKVCLIGSPESGRAVMRSAADRLKSVLLELGGKNAFIACPDVDVDKAAKAAIDGMNFTWCGQSCGSTSRTFIHESIYDEMIERMSECAAYYKPGIPTDPKTTMGAIISQKQMDRVLYYINAANEEGAKLVTGGKRPDAPELKNGFFVEPTIFCDVQPEMKVAREEVFGPVLSVFKWSDENELIRQVNDVEYGLTAAIWTNDLGRAHRLARRIQVGYVWINDVSKHFIGAGFGGTKQSGLGREGSLEELYDFTENKNINVAYNL